MRRFLLASSALIYAVNPFAASPLHANPDRPVEDLSSASKEEIIDLLSAALARLIRSEEEASATLPGERPAADPAEPAKEAAPREIDEPGSQDVDAAGQGNDDIIDLLAATLKDLNSPNEDLSLDRRSEPAKAASTATTGEMVNSSLADDPALSAILEADNVNKKLMRLYNSDPAIEAPIDSIRQHAFPIMDDGLIHFVDLYFDANSSELSPASIRRLEETVNWIRLLPLVENITIVSQTDTRGSSLDNRDRAQSRAENVARYLYQEGLNDVQLSVETLGERQIVEQTDDDVSEPRNRVVSIWGQ